MDVRSRSVYALVLKFLTTTFITVTVTWQLINPAGSQGKCIFRLQAVISDFLNSAFASVCLRLEGFILFCIPVPRQLEPLAMLRLGHGLGGRTTGKRYSFLIAKVIIDWNR
jgi:hypothetical protein